LITKYTIVAHFKQQTKGHFESTYSKSVLPEINYVMFCFDTVKFRH